MAFNNPNPRLFSRQNPTPCQSRREAITRERLNISGNRDNSEQTSLFQHFRRAEDRSIEQIEAQQPSSPPQLRFQSTRSSGRPSPLPDSLSSPAERSTEKGERSSRSSTSSERNAIGDAELSEDNQDAQEASSEIDAWMEDEYYVTNMRAAIDAISNMVSQIGDNCAIVLRSQERLKNNSSQNRHAFENVVAKFARLSCDHRVVIQKTQNLNNHTSELKDLLEMEKNCNRKLSKKCEDQERKLLQVQLANARNIETKKRDIQTLQKDLDNATSKLADTIDSLKTSNAKKAELLEKLQEAKEAIKMKEMRLEKSQQEWEASIAKEKLNVNDLYKQLEQGKEELRKGEENSKIYQNQIERLSADAKRFEDERKILGEDKASLENQLKALQKDLDGLSKKADADRDVHGNFLREVLLTVSVITNAYVDLEITKVSREEGVLEVDAQKISLFIEPLSLAACESLNEMEKLTKIPATTDTVRNVLHHMNIWGKEVIQSGSIHIRNQRKFLRKIEVALDKNLKRAVVALEPPHIAEEQETCDQNENQSSLVELSSVHNMFNDLIKNCSKAKHKWLNKVIEVERKKVYAEEQLKSCQKALQSSRDHLKQTKTEMATELRNNHDKNSEEIDRIIQEKEELEQQLHDSQNAESCLRKEHNDSIQQSEKRIKKIQTEHDREIKKHMKAHEKEVKKLNLALETERKNCEKELEQLKNLKREFNDAEKDHTAKIESLEGEVCKLRDLMTEEAERRQGADKQIQKYKEDMKKMSLEVANVSQEAKNAKEVERESRCIEAALKVKVVDLSNQLEETRASLAHSRKEVEAVTKHSFDEKTKAEQRLSELEASLKIERRITKEKQRGAEETGKPFGTLSQIAKPSGHGFVGDRGAQAYSGRKQERLTSGERARKRRMFSNTVTEVSLGSRRRRKSRKGEGDPGSANDSDGLIEEYCDMK